MTPSQKAKSVGLKSLTQVKDLIGKSLNTLSNWHRESPDLFDVVLLGCLVKLGKEPPNGVFNHESSEYVVRKPSIEGVVGIFDHDVYEVQMRKVKPTFVKAYDYTQNIKELEFLLSQIGKEIKLHEGARESIELAIKLMRKI